LNKNNGILSSGKKKKEEVVQNLVQTILHAELGTLTCKKNEKKNQKKSYGFAVFAWQLMTELAPEKLIGTLSHPSKSTPATKKLRFR
jgi:hypothetical protein